MSLGENVAANLPYLRRYARALTGAQSTGDAFVRQTLEAALADDELKSSLSEGRVALYRAFNKIWSSASVETDIDTAGNGGATGDHEVAAHGASVTN